MADQQVLEARALRPALRSIRQQHLHTSRRGGGVTRAAPDCNSSAWAEAAWPALRSIHQQRLHTRRRGGRVSPPAVPTRHTRTAVQQLAHAVLSCIHQQHRTGGGSLSRLKKKTEGRRHPPARLLHRAPGGDPPARPSGPQSGSTRAPARTCAGAQTQLRRGKARVRRGCCQGLGVRSWPQRNPVGTRVARAHGLVREQTTGGCALGPRREVGVAAGA